ncbi:MAG: hypothetical protein K0S18_164 [Anaerocolumna sp.]|jgi:hypothetical protein|nr:hypothetical protein [Anaerocolumna sp.]
MDKQQFVLAKIPLKLIIKHSYNVEISKDDEVDYLIAQSNSILFDQIERIRGSFSERINEFILVEAPKNPKTENELRYVLNNGFTYNGVNYVRFGKSASQGKDGITAFCDANIYEELFMVTQMDVEIDECVISKYEAQRCLPFSSCTLIKDKLPYIVVIGEYKKVLEDQYIRYVVEKDKEYTDEETGEVKKYKAREIDEGYHSIELSPFDGCGCHSRKVSEMAKTALGLDYIPIGLQIRLPFFKGYSVEFEDFNIYLKYVLGTTEIPDIFGNMHNVDDIDCLWNISMFKGFGIFKNKYGSDGWNKYLETIEKYQFKLGVSKYSHHLKDINLMTKMNFQYLQCLDLWNDKYIKQFEEKNYKNYNILDPENEGKMIKIAKYSTDLCEKIIKGDKFYTYKFLGINDTDRYEAEGKYLEAALINDVMLKDPAVKQYIHRKLKKTINDMKYGKIYSDGFYHTVVGDMIGYLEYASGKEPVGCLKAKEFYCDTIRKGKVLSFRSPLVCPSEVNDVNIVENEITNKWFSNFKDQDVVMINMYDLSAPQQGGMDEDGDAIKLDINPIIVSSKIDKPIIIDIEDKVTAKVKKYNKDNITDYEVNSRDNRIGEITNVATSIRNMYTTDAKWKKIYDDYVSLLRIFQGKEIDFQKTGVRWQMNKGLRRFLKQLPFFLMYNYPKKMNTYYKLKRHNKSIQDDADKVELNAYHSPSPMNELADYIDTWEKKKIVWDRNVVDTRCLILNSKFELNDKRIINNIKHLINEFADKWREMINEKSSKQTECEYNQSQILINQYKKKLSEIVTDEEILANYVIKVSYSNMSISKVLAWNGYGDYIIKNLKENTPEKKRTMIVETPYKTEYSYEYLGKYYELWDGEKNV